MTALSRQENFSFLIIGDKNFFRVASFVPSLETSASGEFIRFKTKGFNYKAAISRGLLFLPHHWNITWWPHCASAQNNVAIQLCTLDKKLFISINKGYFYLSFLGLCTMLTFGRLSDAFGQDFNSFSANERGNVILHACFACRFAFRFVYQYHFSLWEEARRLFCFLKILINTKYVTDL